jgi:hypothetical protein
MEQFMAEERQRKDSRAITGAWSKDGDGDNAQ